jgi:hypothetical protein
MIIVVPIEKKFLFANPNIFDLRIIFKINIMNIIHFNIKMYNIDLKKKTIGGQYEKKIWFCCKVEFII